MSGSSSLYSHVWPVCHYVDQVNLDSQKSTVPGPATAGINDISHLCPAMLAVLLDYSCIAQLIILEIVPTLAFQN